MDEGIVIKGWRYLFGRGAKSAVMQTFNPSASGTNRAVIRPSDYGAQIRANRGVVFACTTLLADGLAAVPLRSYVTVSSRQKAFKITKTRPVAKAKKDYIFSKAVPGSALAAADDIEELTDHPLPTLLKDVNGHMNGFDLLNLTVQYGALTGNCYWGLVKSKLGTPTAIWVLPAEFMSVKPDSDVFVGGYDFRKGSEKIPFDADEVVHFKRVSPLSIWYGVGSLVPVSAAYNLREHMNEYETTVFKNGGMPRVVLVSKTTLSAEQAKRIEATWRQKYGGKNKNGIAVMGDDIEINDLTPLSPRDMGNVQGYRHTEKEIVNAFKVPMSLLDKDSTRANAHSGLFQLAKFALAPECARIDQKITEQLCPQFDDKVFVMFDNPVPEDKEFQLQETTGLVKAGVISIDEARTQHGYEAHGGNAEQLWVDANRVPLEQAGVQQAAAQIAELAYGKAKARMDKERG